MRSNHLFVVLLLFVINLYGQKTRFSKEEVLSDLETLRNTLETAHYNVYAYTSEKDFAMAYEQVKASIQKDSLSLLETLSLYQRLTSVVNNGHTEINFPAQSYIAYAQNGGTIFPLEIALENGKALVRKNWSDNKEIEVGAEISSINDLSISEILKRIYPQVSAERPYLKNAKIELYSFPRYYWQVFGEQDIFKVELSSGSTNQKHTLNAIDVIEDYESKRTEIIASQLKLDFIGPVAYLNPGGFGGDEEKYRQFIDSAFAVINEKKTENLIIDLRNNPGGNDSFSDYLVSYIADKEFKWNSNFTLKTSKILKEHARKNSDTTSAYWQSVLAREDGEIYEYDFEPYQPQATEKRFAGKVYVLINRQSHSQAAVTAAQIQDYDFGTIVGEETGDYPSLYASIFQYELPETGIPVNISKGFITRVNGSKKEEGVIPDIFIKDHLLDENDEILEGIVNIIEEKS